MPGAARTLVLVLVGVGVSGGAGMAGSEGPAHDRAFWNAIVAADYVVPEGVPAMALMRELSELLASADPDERDGFGYGIAVRWIYFQKLFSPEELHELLDLWTANLRRGIGETGTDSVLLRSFSALDLSILAALDNESPFLEEAAFRKLLGAALEYLEDEQDVRGYVDGKGWLHSPAHTADLFKFLARSSHLRKKDQGRILQAVAAKMTAPDGDVYRHGEDERLARTLLSILGREDADLEGFGKWLEQLDGMSAGLWEGPLDRRRFAAVQNTKNLLKSLYVLLSAEDSPSLESIRGKVLQTISGL